MKEIPIDHVGYNVYETGRFNINYELNKGERFFAFFCTLILAFGGLFMLIHWMFHVATD